GAPSARPPTRSPAARRRRARASAGRGAPAGPARPAHRSARAAGRSRCSSGPAPRPPDECRPTYASPAATRRWMTLRARAVPARIDARPGLRSTSAHPVKQQQQHQAPTTTWGTGGLSLDVVRLDQFLDLQRHLLTTTDDPETLPERLAQGVAVFL